MVVRCINHWKMCHTACCQSDSKHCMEQPLYKPPHDKTNTMTVRPAKTQISLGICPVWSECSLSTWRKPGSLDTYWVHSEDWSDWADVQADLSLCWAHRSFYWFCHEAAHIFFLLAYPPFAIQAKINWAASSEFVSSSIPSWQILTAHAQSFRGARDLAFCLKVPLDSPLVWASSGGSGETAQMRRLAWTFAARIGDKYQIRLTRPNCYFTFITFMLKCLDLQARNCHFSSYFHVGIVMFGGKGRKVIILWPKNWYQNCPIRVTPLTPSHWKMTFPCNGQRNHVSSKFIHSTLCQKSSWKFLISWKINNFVNQTLGP